MASNKIKGITIEIGGDTTKLGKALDDVTKNSKSLQTELNQINRMLKFDPSNVELLTQKQQVLTEQLEETTKKLNLLKEAEEQVQRQFENGEIGADQYRAFQREIQATESRLQSLTTNLEDTKNQLSNLGADTTKASSAFKDLADDINKQEKELNDLKEEYKNVVLEQGNSSDRAKELKTQINSLNSELNENKTRLDSVEKEADQLTKSLDDLGSEAKDTEGGFTIMKGAIADLASNAIQSAVSAVGDFVSGLFELSEATEEYRTMMSKVEGSATSFGYEIEWAKDRYKELYTYLNDDQMATNAITNLMGLQVETSKLESLVDGAIGVWASYGDSIPIESLTESINETIQVGKVTGVMADTINWAKLSNEQWTKVLGKNSKAQQAFNKALADGEAVEDAFSSALASTADMGERADIVARMLNDTYGESKRVYDENTQSILENREAQAELKEVQAELGETLQPINTEFTRLQAEVLSALAPAIEEVAEKFLEMVEDIDWEAFGETLGDVLGGAIDILGFLAENIDIIAVGLGGATVAWGAYKLATEGATIAQKLFNLAQSATPWGLIATVIGGAVTAIGTYVIATQNSTDVTNENVEATKELADTYDDLNESIQESKDKRAETLEGIETEYRSAEILTDKLDSLRKVEDKSNGQKALMAEYVNQLNEIIPDLNLQYDEEADKLNMSTDAIRQNIEASKELAIAKAKQEFLTEIATQIAKAELEQAKAVEQHKANEEALMDAQQKRMEAYQAFMDAGGPFGAFSADEGRKYQEALAYEEELQKAYEQSGLLIDDYGYKIRDLNSEYDSLSETIENEFNSIDIGEQLGGIVEQCRQAGIAIPQTLTDNIKAGMYAVPTSIEEMKSLITLDDLVWKSSTTGIQIPQSLADGIKNGSTAPSVAIDQMNNLVEFGDLLDKADIAGEQVPDFLAQSIAEGKTKPKDAVDQMQRLVSFNELLENSELAGMQVPETLQQAILDGSIKPERAMEKLRDQTLSAIDNLPDETGKIGGQAVKMFESEVKDNNIKSTMSKVGTDGAKALSDTKGQYEDAGEDIIRGAEQGAKNKQSSFWTTLSNIASNALDWFKSTLGISSPSKAFMEATGWIPEGMAVGIDKNKAVALDAMDDLANDLIKEGEKINDLSIDDIEIKTKVDKPIIDDIDDKVLNGNIDRQLDSTFTVNDMNINQSLDRIFNLLADILPNMSNEIVLDSGTIVGEIAPLMDTKLGQIRERNKRI